MLNREADDEVDGKLQRAGQIESRFKSRPPLDGGTPDSPDANDGGDLDDPESSEENRDEDSRSAILAAKIRLQTIKAQNREQDIELRKTLAGWSIKFVGGQLVASNIFFLIYLCANKTDMDPAVMVAWLGASVIEVIGILLVIARSLFPVKKNGSNGNDNGGG
ncbi:hypothetical protein I0Q12_05395 [Rhodococcus sp. CX]|uniref:hypothetical protein n=1 Tax=Rhodococcus sp. CX TaxID=2789880 RepID=UPI0018CF2794|nr:hypothetical protein [Rhodococcus sp. CX]MBH0118992.1 hypothetical protein [Rhodococcus sp. CX]